MMYGPLDMRAWGLGLRSGFDETSGRWGQVHMRPSLQQQHQLGADEDDVLSSGHDGLGFWVWDQGFAKQVARSVQSHNSPLTAGSG
jgi:hypothetical protein